VHMRVPLAAINVCFTEDQRCLTARRAGRARERGGSSAARLRASVIVDVRDDQGAS
jgi:hypothetical protein